MAQRERKHKCCKHCGTKFFKHPKHSRSQWINTEYCSPACANKARSTHGKRHTRLYRVWAGIKNRCLNANDPLFAYYGNRGISICQEWQDNFAAFAAHMGNDPGPEFDVGRIDNNLGYQPDNVRWETKAQNMRNKRNTIWIELNGIRMPLIEACEKAGVPYKRAHARLKAGWSIIEALQQ